MKTVLESVVQAISHDLDLRGVSCYARAKGSGLRPDVIKRIEAGEGKYTNAAAYIESYCRQYPDTAYKLFYNAASSVAYRYK